MNIHQFIEQTTQRFTQANLVYGHGTTCAFDEAVWLTLWQLKLPLDELESIALRTLTQTELLALNALIEKRITTRQPAAYLTNEAWLQGIPFYVDKRTIIPRSLIAEILVEGQVDSWLDYAVAKRKNSAPNILDLCTGNGSLAILAAMIWPEATLTATDISQDALDVAAINLERHQLQDRVALVLSNALQAPEIKTNAPYDLIICNPPYVNTNSMQALPSEYLAEPALALAGGTDGMDFIRPLLAQISNYLSDEAILLLEIGNEREHFEAAFPHLPALWLETSAGEDQVLLLTRNALLQT